MRERTTLEDAWRQSRGRGNNFDALRLAAASSVMVSHSFLLSSGRHEREFIPSLAGGVGVGEVAVFVFFSISGFLIAKSWMAEPVVSRFAVKRAARILPGLAFVVAALVFIIGPIATSLPAGEYFSSPDTWRFLLNIFFMSQHGELAGVFADNPFPHRVDNSLWTLGFEAACYAGIALLGVMRALNWRVLLAAALLLQLIGGVASLRYYGAAGDALFKMTMLAPHFIVGAAFATLAGAIPLNARLAALSAIALVLAAVFGPFIFIFSFCGTYLVLYVAFADLGPLARIGKFGDFSYGVYLWGWPAQQIAQSAFRPDDWLGNLCLGAPLALLFAVASWRLVEKPALALKAISPRSRRRRREDAGQRAPAASSSLP